jgi:hypothetical protein
MSFLNSLNDRLTAIEREVQNLPGALDSIVRRLDRGKLKRILDHLEQDCDRLYEKQSAAQGSGVITLPLVFSRETLSFTPITGEDRSRWREAYKSELRVLIGEGKVKVMAVTELAEKYNTTASQIAIVAWQQGYIVLRWRQYIKLLAEIAKLI